MIGRWHSSCLGFFIAVYSQKAPAKTFFHNCLVVVETTWKPQKCIHWLFFYFPLVLPRNNASSPFTKIHLWQMYFFENTTFCACLYYHHRILSVLSRTFVIWSHVFVPQDMTFLESRAIKKSRFSFCCSPLFSWWSTRKHFFTNEVGTQLIIMSFSGTFVLCLVIAYSMKWYLFRDTGSRVPKIFFSRSNKLKTY